MDLVGAAVAVILREALERVQRPAAVRGGERALMCGRGAAALGVEFVRCRRPSSARSSATGRDRWAP